MKHKKIPACCFEAAIACSIRCAPPNLLLKLCGSGRYTAEVRLKYGGEAVKKRTGSGRRGDGMRTG